MTRGPFDRVASLETWSSRRYEEPRRARVRVLGPVRTLYTNYFSGSGGQTGLRLVDVIVEGEAAARRISACRLHDVKVERGDRVEQLR